MRTHNISIIGDKIIKIHSTTRAQQEKILAHFDEYAAWIRQNNFAVPETKVTVEGELLTMTQRYIEGRDMTRDDWAVLTGRLMSLPDQMPYGLDASPANFLFKDDMIYFVDFYPLFVKDGSDFLASQFPYGEKLVVQRYFNKWSVIVCFLNRLKLVNPEAFSTCVAIMSTAIQVHLFELPGRDVRRLSQAIMLSRDDFCNYYELSKPDEKPLTLAEINHLRLLLIAQTPEGLSPDADIAVQEGLGHLDKPLVI